MSDTYINKIRKLDGSLLLIFSTLIETKNTKETAARLSLSQSAISHALVRLRVLFDDPLFIRRPHGLEPTKRTLTLQVKVKQLLSVADDLLDISSQFDPASSSKLFVIAAPDYLTAQIAAPLIKTWQNEAPSLSLYYRHVGANEAIDDVRRGEFDLAIGRFEKEVSPELERTPLYEDVYCVVARRKHPRVRNKLAMAEYERERHVLASERSEVTIAETSQIPKMPSGVIVGSWTTALSIVAQTDALATCHRKLAESHRNLLQLQLMEPPFKYTRFQVSVVHRRHPEESVLWLLGQVKNQLRK